MSFSAAADGLRTKDAAESLVNTTHANARLHLGVRQWDDLTA